MRILHATDNFRPAVGGLERVVEGLAVGLRGLGHDVAVATLSRSDAPDVEFYEGIAIYRLTGYTAALSRVGSGAEHQFHPTTVDPRLRAALTDLIAEFEPDVIHVHSWVLNTLLSMDLEVPLVVSLHDYGLKCATKTMIRNGAFDALCSGASARHCLPCSSRAYGAVRGIPLATGLLERSKRLRRVDKFLPISRSVADALVASESPERVQIVPSFVDDALLDAPTGDVPDWVPDAPFVLFVGALGEHKGVATLLEAHRRMREDVPLVYVGTIRDDTPDLVGDGAREVIARSDIPHATIMEIMSKASVVAVPSRWPEPLGLVAIEAMCRSTAVVAADIGALPELVVDDLNGRLVAPGDSMALARAIDSVVSDREYADRLGSNGRVMAGAYLASTVIPQVVGVYEELCA
ncbi:glycosyltransferase family 4 protein [Gordonia sputi]|uniref:glycosyltransferase family 4 protein n=1 Tax=Gordonia sputi TaxID=36823 RepID=UPI0036C8B3BF